LGYSIINDIIFKIVFASEENKPLLIALLNAILGFSGRDKIVEIKILNPSIDKEFMQEKNSILDIKARDSQNRYYNIEVQVEPDRHYKERSMYYLSRLFGGQLEPGMKYGALMKTIGISITDFTLFEELPELHNIYRFMNISRPHELTDKLELHYIELSKYNKEKPYKEMTIFEKWLYLLKYSELYSDRLEPIPEALHEEEGIEMAITAFRKAISKDEVREMIEFRHKARLDEASRLDDMLNAGIEKGIEKGKIESAKIFLEMGGDRSEIAKRLGLKETDF